VVSLVLSASLFAQSPTVPAQSYLRNNSFVNWESPHVHPLDITSSGQLLAVNTPNNSLEVYNANGATLTFVKSIPVGLDPVTVRAFPNNSNQAWVVNVISDSVSIVDLAHGIVTQTLQVNDEPADVVFAGPSASLALVSCAQAKTVLVFNANNPTVPTAVIPINGEQPRALAVDPNGRYVYLAIFESGNATTAVVGGASSQFENDLVQNKTGPYGGVGVPPNNGTVFNPPFNRALPAPPVVSIIVKRTLVGGAIEWLDDNLRNWARFISGAPTSLPATPGNRVAGWDMPDRDVAIIDTTSNSVTYQSGLMNILMAIGVNSKSGAVSVVGTDATNQIRYEPVLQGAFTRVHMGTFTPGGANTILDLNPHITSYLNPVSAKGATYTNFAPGTGIQNSIGDPRAIVWNSAGTQAYITGMGSNNVIVVSPTATQATRVATINNVGQGPTGLVLYNGNAYVLNKFDGTISTISTTSNSVTATTPLYFDPTPAAIKIGRPILYNTTTNSSLGQLSCASCHVDARWDRLAWDLGNPAGSMLTNPGVTNSGNSVTYHPMKGPFLTMTLVDTMQAPFFHWRGDRPVLEDFADAFQTLMGAPQPATPTQIAELQGFLATVALPPNPNRNIDNSYPAAVPIIGPNNTVTGTGNAAAGAAEFEANCRSCHPGHTNRGSLFIDTNIQFGAGIRNPPTWKNFYKRQGVWFQNATATNVGFGFQQDGTFDATQNDSRDNNMMAFMMAFNGGYPYEPAGLNATNWSNNTHAAVGKQVTVSPTNPTDTSGLLHELEVLGDQGVIGLVAKGGVVSSTVRRGYMYLGNGVWQSDHLTEVDSTAAMNALVANGATLTFTAVPNESAARIGIDMDSDGILDSDDAQPALANVNPVDLALAGTATAASVYDANHTAAQAIDGNTIGYFDQNSMLHTQGGTNDWFQEDLGVNAQINLVQLFNRWDCCANRLANVSVFISEVPFVSTDVNQTRAQTGVKEFYVSGVQGALAQIPMQTAGRYVRVQLNDAANPAPLQLAEVRLMGYEIASFTVPATQTVAAGHSVNLILALNNPTPNARYTYSALNLPPGLSINPTTGAISGSVSSTAESSYATTVTAIGTTGAGSPSVSFNWNVTGSAPPFTLAAPPLTLEAGTGGTTPVTVTPAAGFSGSVSLSLAGLPSGASSAFLANSTTSFILVIYAPPTVTPGTYPLTITGKSGSVVETTTLNLVITPPVSVSQTITFGPIAAQIVGTSLTVSATASSGLPVSFTLVQNGNCSISGNTVTFLNVGNCGVIANQAGNSTYSAAPAVGQVIVVNQ
jgi:DNA-binding beta-propeller fold protein YncE